MKKRACAAGRHPPRSLDVARLDGASALTLGAVSDTLATMADLAAAMRARSTAELRLACSRDAGDYTPEAIEAARTELVRRGEDVSALVAAPARDEPSSPVQSFVGRIVVILLAIPLIAYDSELPALLRLGGWVVIGGTVLFLRADAWRRGGRRNARSDRDGSPPP
jgi:hypothetical protein